ncbi:hypothetical protein DV738_g4413, partial [Chaetothyriales sp. CBS 135597]
MDAKPHRPLRAVRVRNDENMPPDAAFRGKTIHHRNKSSPALSIVAASGALAKMAPPKRTAFGDVSNIAALPPPSKDDSALLAKAAGATAGLKAVAIAPLTKPPQRPLSVHKAQTTEPAALPQMAGNTATTSRVLSKRATTIFKDSDAPSQRATSIFKHSDAPNPVPQTKPAQPPPKSVQVQAEPLANPAVQSNTSLPPQPLATNISLPGIEAVSLVSTSHNAYPLPHISQPTAAPAVPEPVKKQDAVVASTIIASQVQPALVAPGLEYLAQPDFAVDQIARIPAPLPEPEDYLDEEDEEHVDDDGYVTALSYRSRADTTTGATTLLFPKASQRARQELSDAKQLVEASRTAEEIEDETFDTSMVTEYGDEIFAYMKKLEISMLPNPHYMDSQHEIQWSMRSVLMDWLVQVHHRFGLLPETLFLCVNYIDRFLSCKVVSLGKLQLVGATAIFIAAKYEEINCPSVQEIVYMVDNGYTVDEILKAERFMLTMLQFELGFPGPMSFLRRISKADDYDLETRTLAKYFLDVTIMDERFLASPPSFAAAASHCLARMMLRKGSWTPHHVHYSGYTFAQLRPLLRLLLECCENPRKHHAAVFNKYSDKRYKRASAFVEAELHRGFRLPADLQQAKPYTGPQLQQFFDTVSYFRT